MVSRKMTQKDIIDEIKLRTDYNKKDLRVVFKVLDDIIIENMNTATYDEPSEMVLFKSWRLGAKRVPDREWRDPRGGTTMASEKLLPYCKFMQSFRDRMNNMEQDEDIDEEIDDDE